MKTSHRTVRVRAQYDVQYPNPITIAAGGRVIVGHEDKHWPGWRWCKAADGRESWVPVELLSHVKEGEEAAVLEDYSARELSIQAGEEVLVEQARHGWLLVRNARGERGWVPANRIEQDGN